MKQRVVWSVLGLTVMVAVAGITVAMAGRPAPQPLAFNHRLHIQNVGLSCADCHRHASSGARATIPNVAVCGDCHSEAIGESPEEAKLVTHVQEGRPIPWRQVYWLPEHVFFSHRRHTAVAGLACETCHGAVAERELPLTGPLVPLSMNACMACHATAGVSNDCIRCHR
ncbi:MAG: cytochrome c3 family protein [Thermoanaerobaculia bacterium]|nr:MAG: cytochrome c3 family protein [Thermoanaerobaculia bacterium]